VIRIFRHKGLQGSQQGRSIGVGRAWLGRDPLPERNLSFDITAVGIHPPPQRVPDPLIRQVGQEPQGQRAKKFSPRLRAHIIIRFPAQALGLKCSVLHQQDLK
jgi:hypothetical protein